MNALDLAKGIEDYVINLRREIHAHPELSEAEFETRKRVVEALEAYGISYELVGNTSIIAEIKGLGKGLKKTIALELIWMLCLWRKKRMFLLNPRTKELAHMCGHDPTPPF